MNRLKLLYLIIISIYYNFFIFIDIFLDIKFFLYIVHIMQNKILYSEIY